MGLAQYIKDLKQNIHTKKTLQACICSLMIIGHIEQGLFSGVSNMANSDSETEFLEDTARSSEGGMASLISIINELQVQLQGTSLVQESLELPQIAVVGAQGVGKSSVLEAIIGHSFLPRGRDIVTRTPIVLQLVNSPEVTPGRQYAEFLRPFQRSKVPMSEIEGLMRNATEQLAGEKGVVNEAIVVRFFSHDVLDLTLVDLPGIVKNAMEDQDTSIVEKIRNMVLLNIRPESTIILAVSAADVDLANSDALNIAKEVDPAYQRTIGVLTKVDKLTEEEVGDLKFQSILTNERVFLQYGYVGVVCRGPTTSGVDTREAIESETKWFNDRRNWFTHAAIQRCGTPFLRRHLSEILRRHIQACMPKLQSGVIAMLNETKNELESMGPTPTRADLLQILLNFSQSFEKTLKDGNVKTKVETGGLVGGASVAHLFKHFQHEINSVDPGLSHAALSPLDILYAVQNSQGFQSSSVAGDRLVHELISQRLKFLEVPSRSVVGMVHDKIQEVLHSVQQVRIITEEKTGREVEHFLNLEDFKTLHLRILNELEPVINALKTKTDLFVRDLIAMEQSWINTEHPIYVGRISNLEILRQEVKEDLSKALNTAKESHTRHRKNSISRISRFCSELTQQGTVSEEEKQVFENKMKQADDQTIREAEEMLAQFQRSESENPSQLPFLEAYTDKESGIRTKRYFIKLQEGNLQWFKTPTDINPKNGVELEGCRVMLLRDHAPKYFTLEVIKSTAPHPFRFQWQTLDEAQQWYDAIRESVKILSDRNRHGNDLQETKHETEMNQARVAFSDFLSRIPDPESEDEEEYRDTVHVLPPGMTMEQLTEMEMIRRKAISYFSIVTRKIEDSIPKAISFLLVHPLSSEKLSKILVRSIYDQCVDGEALANLFDDGTAESVKRRQILTDRVQRLESAKKIIMRGIH